MKTIQIQKRRRKTMNKKEVEGIEKVIKEYLKKNLRMESRVNMSQASRDGRMVNKLKGKCIKGTEIQRSYIPKLIGMGFTRKEVSEITGLGHQLISDYYIKYKNKYEK